MGPEVNDHVSLQWPSYEQPHGSNMRPQMEQTSWSQALTTGPSYYYYFFLQHACGHISTYWNIKPKIYSLFQLSIIVGKLNSPKLTQRLLSYRYIFPHKFLSKHRFCRSLLEYHLYGIMQPACATFGNSKLPPETLSLS